MYYQLEQEPGYAGFYIGDVFGELFIINDP